MCLKGKPYCWEKTRVADVFGGPGARCFCATIMPKASTSRILGRLLFMHSDIQSLFCFCQNTEFSQPKRQHTMMVRQHIWQADQNRKKQTTWICSKKQTNPRLNAHGGYKVIPAQKYNSLGTIVQKNINNSAFGMLRYAHVFTEYIYIHIHVWEASWIALLRSLLRTMTPNSHRDLL